MMPYIKFTQHLKRFFPDLDVQRTQVTGRTVAEAVQALDVLHPGLTAYIVDERGALRKHVNIFIGDELVRDREALQDVVESDTQLFIFQALSGG